jgi:DNA polymerase (family 10)
LNITSNFLQSLTVTNGLNEKRLEQQGKEIDKLNKEISQGKFGEPYKHFKILKGAEINILKDGSFDIANEALKKLDVVAAAVHSHFRMTREEMTQRIIKAMQHPYLNILFHPTGRIINKRPPYEVDMEKIITAAKKYNIALELDCFPERMDLKDEHVRIAVQAGVKIVIDSDAHAPEHLKFIKFGEATARRGWAEKKDVINTKNAAEVITFFRKKR